MILIQPVPSRRCWATPTESTQSHAKTPRPQGLSQVFALGLDLRERASVELVCAARQRAAVAARVPGRGGRGSASRTPSPVVLKYTAVRWIAKSIHVFGG